MNAKANPAPASPEFPELWGHPRPLWMLFMAEFWERFAFYGIRWALTLYIVAQFFNGDASGQQYASKTYGAYLALVYASAIFGGLVADRVIGYQRSILVGAVIMGAGLFMITIPNQQFFLLGLATVIVGNGLFKPNISSLVGQVYKPGDQRRDAGFSIFYMGINAGGFLSPIVTQWLASVITDTPFMQNYKVVFASAGIGMVLSYIWFYFGRKQLLGVGAVERNPASYKKLGLVIVGAIAAIFPVYLLMAYVGASILAWILFALFIGLAGLLIMGGRKLGEVATHRVYAMLTMFTFNILFFMFFEQAGSSFNFLAQNIVNRDFGSWEFPIAWFQSVNSLAIIAIAPLLTMVWFALSKKSLEPSIPRKFALGLLGNALGFAVLIFALSRLVDDNNMIPFWTLAACYVFQTVGELCLSPVGLSMTTKLAPPTMIGSAMGGWFLSTAIGNNFSGLLASEISGATGMTIESALSGFTFSFWLLTGAGVFLFVIGPMVAKWTHGVK